jgi:endonuclease III
MCNSLERLLVSIGKARFDENNTGSVQLVEDDSNNSFLNDLAHYPHAYVLACGMDRQIKSERAWMIPLRIRETLGTFEIDDLANVTEEEYIDIFNRNTLHRFNSVMAKTFYSAVQKIVNEYNGNASKIWSDQPSSAAVVYRFLQFDGYGVKIATMATNILARQFKVPLSDYCSIDISPDVHIFRVLSRCGLVEPNASIESIIYKAREINPEFPGIIDFSCWEIGRSWCKPESPNCKDCILSSQCKKLHNYLS